MLHGLLVFTQHGMGMKDAAPWKSDGSVTVCFMQGCGWALLGVLICL